MDVATHSEEPVFEPGNAHRDGQWLARVDLEIVRMMADREKRSIIANFLGWVACAFLALAFPDPSIFVFPLIFRLASMSFTRFAGNRLRKTLKQGRPYDQPLLLVKIGLCIGGVSWGAMVWPLTQLTEFPPAAIAYAGFIMVGASLVLTLLGAVRAALLGYLSCFVVSAGIGIASMSEIFSPFAIIGMVVVLTCAAAFSLSVAKHNRLVAETMVDNQRLSEELADALAHAEFLSQRDPLTGLLNRRAFLEVTSDEDYLNRSQYLLAIDLDHFKAINDTFGHDLGDRVLIGVGDILRECPRSLGVGNHMSVRLGGEEFLVLIDNADAALASLFAEQVRARIHGLTRLFDMPGLSISASIGCARWKQGESLAEALNLADVNMYRAKTEGRNRVVRQAA